MKRRQFIRAVMAASVLSLGGISAFQWYQQSTLKYPESLKTKFLNEDDQLLLSVLIPVMAAGMPAMPNIEKTIINIDEAVIRLPLATQDELRELFSILGTGLGRLALTGVWLNWQQASSEELDQALTDWREHKLDLLQRAYIGLQKLIIGSVYAESIHWQGIDYPGPIQLNFSG